MQGCVWVEWRWRGGVLGQFRPESGLTLIHGDVRTCASDVAGTDLSRSIGQVEAQHRIREQM